jgi:hypothetical protein
MSTVIFYSWQSDLPNSTNRGFIQKALERATKEIESDESVAVEPVIDRDTAGIPGSPDIATTILQKIDKSDVFSCDVSIINSGSKSRPTPNPNVLIELGYALKRMGWGRILMIMNTAYGSVETLPFDLRMKRVITYEALEGGIDLPGERKRLQTILTTALKAILTHTDAVPVTELKSSDIPSLDDLTWRDKMREIAKAEFSKSGLESYVEAFAVLSPPKANLKQSSLLEAVRISKINTFGWPIGVMGESQHMRPKPLADGIFNSIYPTNMPKMYDFWALRKDGSFYLLKSLYEDHVADDKLFFNTRIVRTTEMLLFLSRLFKKLDFSPDTIMSFSLVHSGLKGRYMSDTGTRHLFHDFGPCEENAIKTNINTNLEAIEPSISLLVSELLSPVFILFDFFNIDQQIYDDIVLKFIAGQVT